MKTQQQQCQKTNQRWSIPKFNIDIHFPRTPISIRAKKEDKKYTHGLLFNIFVPVQDFHGFTFKTQKGETVPAGGDKSLQSSLGSDKNDLSP